jgi:hypothetical protein
MKIRPVGAELFHAAGQTDMTKLTLAFRNFANAPKKRYTRFNCVVIPVTPTYIFATDVIIQACGYWAVMEFQRICSVLDKCTWQKAWKVTAT